MGKLVLIKVIPKNILVISVVLVVMVGVNYDNQLSGLVFFKNNLPVDQLFILVHPVKNDHIPLLEVQPSNHLPVKVVL